MKVVKVSNENEVYYFSNTNKASDFLNKVNASIVYAIKRNTQVNGYNVEYTEDEAVSIAWVNDMKNHLPEQDIVIVSAWDYNKYSNPNFNRFKNK